MVPRELDKQTLEAIRRLVEANYVGRDMLYAAAEMMDDDTRDSVCRRLAEFLAGHAAELQQILMGCGAKPVEIEDIPAVAELVLFDLVKANRGEAGVIEAAECCEQSVEEKYDQAVDDAQNSEAQAIMERQKKDVEFGEQVLRTMRDEVED